jgi:hypothetical protein
LGNAMLRLASLSMLVLLGSGAYSLELVQKWALEFDAVPAHPTFYPSPDQPEMVVVGAGDELIFVDPAEKSCGTSLSGGRCPRR